MKIAFCGDSFCADTGQGTWPYLVRKQTKSILVCKGKQGASEYSILNQAKKVIGISDLIIFTHTDPYRLANRHDEPLGARPCDQVFNRLIKSDSNLLKVKKNTKDNIWTAGHLYYEHLMEYGFHELSHIALVKECNNLCKDKKVIHLFSFSTKELDFRDYNWDVRLENSYNKKSLARISYDYQTPDNDEQKWAPGDLGWVTLPNHMNYAGNKVVSEIVLGML